LRIVSWASEQAECDADLFLDPRHGGGRERADRWIAQEALFDGSDLIAFRPAVEIKAALFRLKRNAQTKFRVLFGGDAHNTNIEGMAIELVHREDDCRARLIELHEIDFAAFGETAERRVKAAHG